MVFMASTLTDADLAYVLDKAELHMHLEVSCPGFDGDSETKVWPSSKCLMPRPRKYPQEGGDSLGLGSGPLPDASRDRRPRTSAYEPRGWGVTW